jgi:UDP-GlcNAc:undecaprenyl-phosphate GlcNAc-1-phosphate transferase
MEARLIGATDRGRVATHDSTTTKHGAFMLTAITPLFIGFLVTMTMMLALRPVASQFGLVDVPGGRKSHSGQVPVIGGIAMFMGLMAAVLAVDVASPREAALMVAAALMVIVGVMDDRFDLAPYARLLAHIAAAVTLVLASGHNVESLGNLLGLGDIGLGPFDLVFTVVAAIALINGFNMLDGLDGLAGGVALVALMGLSFYFLGGQGGAALVVSLGLVGSIVAFLIFNLPARFNRPFLAFMGDAGSTMLGFVLAGLALLAVQPRGAGMPPVVVLWLLPVPILELFTSTIRRAVTGLSPMQADRGHFHHRLLDAGFSVRAVFVLYLAVSVSSAVIGIWLWKAGASEPVLFYVFLALSAVWLVGMRNAKRLAGYLPESLRRGRLPPLRRHQRSRAARNRS